MPDDSMRLAVLDSLTEYAPDGVWQIYNEKMGELSKKLMENANPAIKKTAKIHYASYINNIAVISCEKGDYNNGLEYYRQCTNLTEEIGDSMGLGLALNSTGAIYDRIGDHIRAMEVYERALLIEEKIKDRKNMVGTLNNIAALYGKKNDDERQLKYYQEAEKIGEDIKLNNHIYSIVHRGLGDLMEKQGKHGQALEYYQHGLKIAEDIVDPLGKASNLTGIANVYFQQGKKTEALEFAKKALSISNEGGYLMDLEKASRLLRNIYESQDNFKDAFNMYKLEIKSRDSLASQENQKSLIRHQFQSAYDKKEIETKAIQDNKDALTAKEIERQKIILYSVIGGLVMLLLLSGVLYNRFLLKKKSNQKLEVAYSELKSTQGELIRQKNTAEEQTQRAEQSEKFKEQFLANMSHEIRTPMNAVNGMTELLIDKNPRKDQMNYLDAIRKSSDTLLHIINDILDLSKIEAGKMELEKIDFSLRETLEQVRQTLSFRAEEKGLQLITEVENSIADVIIGDPVRLNQILVNLGGNAIKFTQRGSVHISVKKLNNSLSPSSCELYFSIIDTGIGIPKEKMETVFESFSQAHSSDSRKYGGTGLGLSISRQLVELQGGHILVESQEGSGTTFSFILNYPVGSSEKFQQRIQQEQLVDGSILNGLKILLADDNEYNRIVARDTLKGKADVAITEASTGKIAIQLIEKQEFDIVLMDVQMPVMDGYEATKYIRDHFSAPKNSVPIIALTASVVRSDLDKCRESGMNSYVAKPFKAWQLIGAIAELTGREKKYLSKDSENKEKNINLAVENTAVITNLEYLQKFCENDRDKMKRYIGMYVNSVPGFVEKIQIGLKNKDRQEIATQVHAFKSKMMMMGMRNTNSLAVKLELLCAEKVDDSRIEEDTKLLLEQINISVTELTEN